MEIDQTSVDKSHKIHKLRDGREISLRRKFETIKIRDALREKCRNRIKESRERNFNQSRAALIINKDWLEEALREELREFEDNIWLEDILYKDLLEESYQWVLDELESEIQYYASIEDTIVICPICKKSGLNLQQQVLQCDCGFSIPYGNTLEQLNSQMQSIVTQHGSTCNNLLIFFVEPNQDSKTMLNVFCDQCDFYANIID